MPRQAREQKFTTQWQKWARASKDNGALPDAAVIEVKVSKSPNDAIPFDAVQDHQIDALMIAKWYKFVYKISDMDMMQKPCDLIYIHKRAGLLIFNFCGKKFYIVDVDTFVEEKDSSTRKSLTEERAAEIALLTGSI